MHASPAATAPYFFLSYAHEAHRGSGDEGEDYWVRGFFLDLCRSVEELAGPLKGAVPGFMERGRRSGEDWPSAMIRALATCRVFVPLYSSRYFVDEGCGKEWAFFACRPPRSAAQGAAIVPGIWDPIDLGILPGTAPAQQVRYQGSKAYESLGLYGIMKVSRYRGEYVRAVNELAGRVLASVEHYPVEDRLDVDYRTLRSAFGPAEAALVGPPDKRVRITVVAPRGDELPDERKNSSFYGSSALDWKPYAPVSARPIAEHAASLTRSLGYWAEVGDLGHHEEALLSGDARSGPQILIIDPWALLLSGSQQLLHRLDISDLPWVQVIIPWNAADDETQRAKGKLQAALDATLRTKLAEVTLTSAMAARGVPGPDDFDLVLRQLIGTVTQKYLSHAAAHPPPGEVVERPRIS